MNILTVKGNRIDNGVLYYSILNNTQTLIVSLANFEKNLKTTNKEIYDIGIRCIADELFKYNGNDYKYEPFNKREITKYEDLVFKTKDKSDLVINYTGFIFQAKVLDVVEIPSMSLDKLFNDLSCGYKIKAQIEDFEFEFELQDYNSSLDSINLKKHKNKGPNYIPNVGDFVIGKITTFGKIL